MIRIAALLTCFCLLFAGCKKYPENTLWFKNPEKTFKGGVITMYTVDGIDKMPLVRSWYHDFPYNFYGVQINNVFDLPFNYSGESISTEYGEGSLVFSPSKKSVKISFVPKNAEYGAQNLFVQNDNWSVLKLTKSGQMKIQAYLGSHTYVIQFN